MHTNATDGKNTIREMAEAGIAHGYEYIAITDHTKNLAMTNGLDDNRALAHIAAIRQVEERTGRRVLRKRKEVGCPIQALCWLEWDENLIHANPQSESSPESRSTSSPTALSTSQTKSSPKWTSSSPASIPSSTSPTNR